MTVDIVHADLAERYEAVQQRHRCGLDDPGGTVGLRSAAHSRALDAAVHGVDTPVDKTGSDNSQHDAATRASANLSGASVNVGR
jgi:hypothetical protein